MSIPFAAAEGDDMQKQLETGRAEARREIAAGKLGWKNLGYPPPWRREFVRLMKERFKVESVEIGDCEPNMPLARQVAGYNEIMKAEIEKHFGKGAVEKAETDAKAASDK